MTSHSAVRRRTRWAARSLALLAAGSTLGCGSAGFDCCGVAPMYRGMNRQVPRLTRPNEIHVAARSGAGRSVEAAVALPWQRFAVFGGAETSFDSSCGTCESWRYAYTEFGLGRLGRRWTYWIGAGRSVAEADDRIRCAFFSSPKCYHFIEARTHLYRAFFQADRAWQTRWLGITSSTRVSQVLSSRHKRLDTTYDPGAMPAKNGAMEGAPSGLFVEPTAEVSVGPAALRVVAQLGVSVVITGKTTFGYRPITAAVGLSTNVAPLEAFRRSR